MEYKLKETNILDNFTINWGTLALHQERHHFSSVCLIYCGMRWNGVWWHIFPDCPPSCDDRYIREWGKEGRTKRFALAHKRRKKRSDEIHSQPEKYIINKCLCNRNARRRKKMNTKNKPPRIRMFCNVPTVLQGVVRIARLANTLGRLFNDSD